MKQATVFILVMMIAIFPINANAGFTIAESVPGQMAIMTNAGPATRTQDISLEVAFVPRNATLTIASKNALKDALEEIKLAAAIHITTYAMQPANLALQKSRGKLIQQWLITNGIPAAKIRLLEAQEANNQRESATITLIPSLPLTKLEHTSTQAVRITHPELATKGEHDKLRFNMMRKLIALAQSKQVKAEDAITMLSEILAMPEGSAASLAPANTVAIDLPRTWTLDQHKTLRENITDWAKIANWQVPDWRSNTKFDFASATLQGSFLEVLAELAKAVPALDFVANKATRVITVVDAGKP